MASKIWSALGTVASAELGLFGASEEHRRFLASGYCCQQCGVRLANAMGLMTVRYLGADGREISQWTGGALRAKTAECPKCGYRWPTFGQAPAQPAPGPGTVEIVETDRSEEPLGEDRRVVDNLRSSATLNRTFSVSKEWTRTCHVEVEHASQNGAELTLGEKDLASLRLSSEKKLRDTYSVSEGTKETVAEDVSYQVSARSKLTVIVRWKRIWQHGFVVVTRDGASIRIPFRAAVGATFDQQQIEEGGDGQNGGHTG